MAAAKKKAGAVNAPKKATVRKAVRKTDAPVAEEVSQEVVQDSTPSAKLHEVDVLDIRALNLTSRVGLAGLLKQEGYIWADGLAPMDDFYRLPYLLEAEALRLNSQNKLVIPQCWNDVSMLDLISAVKVRTDVKIFLDKPSGKYPKTIEVGEATYLRVG